MTMNAAKISEKSPFQEGRDAAREHRQFSECPYLYGNCGVLSVEENVASGNGIKRNLWFKGWRKEQTAMGLNSQFMPLIKGKR